LGGILKEQDVVWEQVEEGMKNKRCLFFVEEFFAWKQRGSESTFPEQ
jgi:putative SOS response-associated peptidase YedK